MGAPVLTVHEVSAKSTRGGLAVDSVSMRVAAGEIVGIAAIEGNGQDELVEVLTGLRRTLGGVISIAGTDVTGADPRTIRACGATHIPADRMTTGAALSLSVSDNLAATTYLQESRWRMLPLAGMRDRATRAIEKFDIRGASASVPIGRLSGGNMQKVVIARETEGKPRLVIVAHPTRGVDLKAVDRIHRHLLALRDSGTGLVLVSSELEELLALSDRILIMFRGRIVADLPASSTTPSEIGEYMTGAKKNAGVPDER